MSILLLISFTVLKTVMFMGKTRKAAFGKRETCADVSNNSFNRNMGK